MCTSLQWCLYVCCATRHPMNAAYLGTLYVERTFTLKCIMLVGRTCAQTVSTICFAKLLGHSKCTLYSYTRRRESIPTIYGLPQFTKNPFWPINTHTFGTDGRFRQHMQTARAVCFMILHRLPFLGHVHNIILDECLPLHAKCLANF